MHIRYSCPVHARQALSRNGTLIDSDLRIGVIPCTEKDIVGVDISRIISPVLNRSAVVEQSNSDEVPQEIPSISPSNENQRTLDDSTNRSNLSMASRAGMRSLTVYYDVHQDAKINCLYLENFFCHKVFIAFAACSTGKAGLYY
ncbi:unnamed protein product [Angiostrongylus costaricensis]|uniref:Nucleoporin NUP35 n=1 Tax=Angiostrongylus costaricensis TaxID=334426 RepID=A0A0R3PG31_ANGCS|nr:unnamed protein product [Angiostrongylus costaricensis]